MDDKEHQYHDQFPPLHRGMTVLPWLVWAFLIGLAIAAVFYSAKVKAEPMAVGSDQDGTITIYTEDCALGQYVSMGNRATWEKNGKVSEGCVSYTESAGYFLVYRLIDKTLWLISPHFFHMVTNA